MNVGDIIEIKLGNENYPAEIIYKDNAINIYKVYVEKINKFLYINYRGQVIEGM